MVHNSLRSSENNVSEQARWEEIVGPFLDVVMGYIETWADDSTFVKTTDKINDAFVTSTVINDGEVANVTCGLHLFKELNNNWVYWADQNLALSRLLGLTY